jgi:uncharacterized protein with PQ loop repeat
MTLADYSVGAFAVLNGARAFAYVPQILCVYQDKNGASAVSITTWALFAMANFATVGYALVVSHDLLVASVFSLNALGCLGIVVLIALKRIEHDIKNAAADTLMTSARSGLLHIVNRIAEVRLQRAKRRLAIELRLSLPSGRRFPLYGAQDAVPVAFEQEISEQIRNRD